MDVLFWNCRGICNPSTWRALKILISQHQPKLVFLIETKIRDEAEFDRLRRNLGFAHAEGVMSVGQARGLGLFWNDDLRVSVRQPSTAWFIDVVVDEGVGFVRWRFTGFYGNPNAADLQESWDLLKALSDEDSLPWVVLGDFNEILLALEKLDGRPRSENQMRGFRDALGYAELADLGFYGCPYTWSDSETKVRLDRVVATIAWSDAFAHSRVQHLPPSKSDHIPILLSISSVPIRRKKRYHRFKFESLWLHHEGCHEIVHQQWGRPISGQPMFLVSKKIERTSIALDLWQRSVFKNRHKVIMDIRVRLEAILLVSLTPALLIERGELMEQLERLLSEEELYWS
ncbi:uncharacterized protein LOC133722875 [Rosa rugosa]|uniref:uncharacterized protein LOC133722875 n=1 Tax=Rosa rugosa TaxID=74645 RepID=UPI002B40C374|nr:uncharacterized protein LOC133722875 [Rosa rugosa]